MNPQLAPRSPDQVVRGASAGTPLDAPDHVHCIMWFPSSTRRSPTYVVSNKTSGPCGARVEFLRFLSAFGLFVIFGLFRFVGS